MAMMAIIERIPRDWSVRLLAMPVGWMALLVMTMRYLTYA